MENTILVVEDDLSLRSALADKLSHEGFLVLEASNGEEGLAQVQSQQPDLILLDIVMPRMDGVAMLKALRATPEGKDTKVIVLTNLGENDKVAEALELGAYDYLVKSDWKIEDVIAKVRGVLGT